MKNIYFILISIKMIILGIYWIKYKVYLNQLHIVPFYLFKELLVNLKTT